VISRPKILLVTVLVAFCSIVYELIYAEALSISFGGQVVRYSITIGLFLFSFGIGALVYNRLNKNNLVDNFIRVEILLSVLGPMGLFFIILLNSYAFEFFYTDTGYYVLLFISHIPIILIGLLSGLELPLLSDLNNKKTNAFAETLGYDYIGSLIGTVLFALYLYPEYGIIITAIVIGFINNISALIFAFSIKSDTRINTSKIVLLTCMAIFLGLLANSSEIENKTQMIYYNKSLTDKGWEANYSKIEISEIKRTKYQKVIFYDAYKAFTNEKHTCMNLGQNVQFCKLWVDAYHKGLVDIPMAFFSEAEREDLNILLIGGGDWIPANYLRKYQVNIDMVDIDEDFTNFTKTHPLLAPYHQDAFNYEKLNLIIEDGYSYLRNNTKKYDLIILDLPGLNDSKLTNFYTQEFMRYVANSLDDDGLAITWAYQTDSEQSAILLSSTKGVGFSKMTEYSSYLGENEKIENYFIFTKNEARSVVAKTDYYNEFSHIYDSQLNWSTIPYDENLKINSVFKPNRDIVISKRVEYRAHHFTEEFRGMFGPQ
jgi:spermidine synthase